ncbi:MAG: hypothetical protein GWO24_15125, partial [Akkermansiaceae bacterium]|nr:hypothetical protein [Akkermansiaceae bacterium]
MAIKIEMPKLSDTMTEGTVVRWLKQVGDEVEIGDEIAEIETDKATMAMEAFDEGILSEILVEEGGTAAIGATLAILREEGDETAGEGEGEAEERPETTDMPAPVAAAEEGSGESRSVPAPVPPPTTGADRIKASPLARKMAEASGLDLAALQGTGPGGRVVKKDIEAAMGGAPTLSPADSSALSAPGPAPPEVLPEPAAAAAVSEPAPPEPVAAPLPPAEPERPSAPEPEAPAPAGKDRRIELSNLRRIIAERLLTSKTTIPHFYLHLEA